MAGKRKQYNHPVAEVVDALGNTKAGQAASQRISDGLINILENIFGKPQGSAYDAGQQARQAWEQSGQQESNPYEELGISPSASDEVVRAAYKAEARRRHPDKGGSEEEMQRLNIAFAKIKEERGMK